MVHEALCTIKVKKLSALTLKMDLVKAYDRVNWSFLKLILLQVDLIVESIDWVMGCVISANFAALINGSFTTFSKCSKGLR